MKQRNNYSLAFTLGGSGAILLGYTLYKSNGTLEDFVANLVIGLLLLTACAFVISRIIGNHLTDGITWFHFSKQDTDGQTLYDHDELHELLTNNKFKEALERIKQLETYQYDSPLPYIDLIKICYLHLNHTRGAEAVFMLGLTKLRTSASQKTLKTNYQFYRSDRD